MLKIFLTIQIFCIVLFVGCDDDSNTSKSKDGPITVSGTYLREDVDKNIWGDFLLVLESSKSKYKITEPILIKLYIENIGLKEILLDGILPYRSSANPPWIDIYTEDNVRISVHKVLDNLLNENKITISPGKSVELMNIDLKNVPGFVDDVEFDNIGTKLEKGKYILQASFHPTPQIYGSNTDTLTFEIE